MAKGTDKGKGKKGGANAVPLNAALERHDVVAMARKFADDLAAGTYGEPLNIMLVLECKLPGEAPDLEVFGWGPDASGLHGIGMIYSAAHILHE